MILIVMAHPDDEVLGFGASGWLAATAGEPVQACILSGDVGARNHHPGDSDLLADIHRAQETLGFGQPILGGFPNIKTNSVPHLDLVQFIEQAILSTDADRIVTHHPYDINDDHRHVARAALAAARLSQRMPDQVLPLREVLHAEILSSTEWQFSSEGRPFTPDTFVEIGEEALETKLKALRAYRGVMRPYPHPRSREAVSALAGFRGAQSGTNLAEAFVTGYRRWSPGLLGGSEGVSSGC